uniref:Gag-Pol polyprotein n=1 Tax=Tanacetum cinerariifolium TaxID=118510 RepID=A0A6L2M0L6_TANCI|nr:hypothetical protein [Tanacetum cinerariifolium]
MDLDYRLRRNTFIGYVVTGSKPLKKRSHLAMQTSLPIQPIEEAIKASNFQRIPPRVQGRSHFTYFLYLIVQIRILNVDTKPNGEALRKFILQGPYKISNIIILSQPITDESPEVLERTPVETFSNISPVHKVYFDAEKEAIHLILTGIRDEIYLTVDACKIAHDIWVAIERLQKGESINKQDVKTSLFWEFGRFTSRDGESIESYYSRLYKLMDKMYQKEVNEIHAKKIAKNANPLARVAAAQQYPNTYYQAPKPHRSYALPAKKSPSTRFHATTRHKGKEIAKPITP